MIFRVTCAKILNSILDENISLEEQTAALLRSVFQQFSETCFRMVHRSGSYRMGQTTHETNPGTNQHHLLHRRAVCR